MEGKADMLLKQEEAVLSAINIDETWRHVEHLSTLDKTSGTEGEAHAHRYVRQKLQEYGVPFKAYELDSLISHPKEAALRVISPEAFEVDCITHSFSASTPKGGMEAELVFVPVQPGSLYAGMKGLVDEYRKADVEGRVALIWGVASPAVMWAAQQAGALGQVHMSGEEVPHDMIVTTIWGTPTPESADRIPKIPAVSVKKSDGERLLHLLEKGEVRISLRARSDTRWMRIPVTVAEIKGAEEPEKFMLVHGHMDSWYLGTTDNCTGNAACLELARLMWKHRERLKRGVRVAWWSGHSTGRYSASTWYADNFFEDLDRNCYLSMNIDSPGVKGASEVGGGGLMGTLRFMAETMEDATGLEEVAVRSYTMRAGDQSFYGIGIPSVAVRAMIPEDSPLRGSWIGGSGGGWWWHSPHDALDKGDKENLHRDLRMEALTIMRSANCAILPFDFTSAADEYEEALRDLQSKADPNIFNLNPVLERIRHLKTISEILNKSIDALKELGDEDRKRRLNELLMKASRILTYTLYTYEGNYDQDPAYGIPLLPALQGVSDLAEMGSESSEARFLRTRMVRQMNRVNHQLDMALELVTEAVEEVKGRLGHQV